MNHSINIGDHVRCHANDADLSPRIAGKVIDNSNTLTIALDERIIWSGVQFNAGDHFTIHYSHVTKDEAFTIDDIRKGDKIRATYNSYGIEQIRVGVAAYEGSSGTWYTEERGILATKNAIVELLERTVPDIPTKAGTVVDVLVGGETYRMVLASNGRWSGIWGRHVAEWSKDYADNVLSKNTYTTVLEGFEEKK